MRVNPPKGATNIEILSSEVEGDTIDTMKFEYCGHKIQVGCRNKDDSAVVVYIDHGKPEIMSLDNAGYWIALNCI